MEMQTRPTATYKSVWRRDLCWGRFACTPSPFATFASRQRVHRECTDCVRVIVDTAVMAVAVLHSPLVVATVSLDGTLKLSSLRSSVEIASYPLPCAGLACCWHPDNEFQVFVGLQVGSLADVLQRLAIPYVGFGAQLVQLNVFMLNCTIW